MRRCLITLSFGLLLCACVRQGPLSSDEVLRRAALAAQRLASARFEASGDFAVGPSERPLKGRFRIPGILQDQGKAFQVLVDLTGTSPQDEDRFSYELKADLISLPHVESYLRLRSLALDPPNAVLRDQLQPLQGRWWRIPSTEEQESSAVTVDPRLLRMQSEVLTVTDDRGIDTIADRDAYHYEVVLDTEKLIAFLKSVYAERKETFDEHAMRSSLVSLDATGNVWIDAEIFVLHRVTWNIRSTDAGRGSPLALEFTVDFTEHDRAPEIEIPHDAALLAPEFFLPLQEQLPL